MKFEKIYENCDEIDRQNQEKIKQKLSRIFENREDEIDYLNYIENEILYLRKIYL